jgi:hypothetical protein
VLNYTALESARTNAVLVGAAVLVLALWVLFSDKDYGLLRDNERPA